MSQRNDVLLSFLQDVVGLGDADPAKKILFVCDWNKRESVMAETLTRIHGSTRKKRRRREILNLFKLRGVDCSCWTSSRWRRATTCLIRSLLMKVKSISPLCFIDSVLPKKDVIDCLEQMGASNARQHKPRGFSSLPRDIVRMLSFSLFFRAQCVYL